MNVDSSKLSAVLSKARICKGYSQTYMANKLKISQKAYSYLEMGKTQLDLLRFIRIAHYTETYPMEIIDRIVVGKPSWNGDDEIESTLNNKIEKLESEITYLKAQNAFLQKLVVKHLETLESLLLETDQVSLPH